MSPSITRLTWLATFAFVGGLSLSASARKAVGPMPGQGAAGMVPLPHVMRDNFGVTWDVQQDGTIGDGGNDLYDGASRLAVNDNSFNAQQTAAFDPAANELSFAPQQIGDVRVSRRVAVNALAGWCRYTEVIENPTTQIARVRLRLNFDMGGGVQTATPFNDPKKNTPLGISIFDGRRAVAMLGGGVGGKVQCNYTSQPNTDQCDLVYDVEVLPRQAAAVVHFQAMRPTNDQAIDFMRTSRDKDLLAGLPKDIRRIVVNFRKGDAVLSNIELPRSELADIIELRSGDQYRGRLTDAVFKLTASHGHVELPADQVIGMVNAGTHYPTQLFVTADGEVVGGRLAGDTLKLQLSSGQNIAVPLSQIAKVGCRKRPGEPEEFKVDKPMLFLRDGQRLLVEMPAAAIDVGTLYGNLKLPPATVAAVLFTGEEQVFHKVVLRDGSRFSGLIPGDSLEVRFKGAAGNGASPPMVKVSLSSIERLQLLPGDIEPPPDSPTLTFRNGDIFSATASGVIDIQTGFDLLKVNGSEIRAIRPVEQSQDGPVQPGEVTITLWGGATLSGRTRQDRIAFSLGGGGALGAPVTAIAAYEHPQPAAPAPIVEQIRQIVAVLGDPDWKKRERAADQLRSIGPAAGIVLRQMRDGQGPETQKQIDTILKAIDTDKPNPAKPRPLELNKDDLFNKDDLILR